MDLDFTISVIILVPYVCQSTFMTCPADLSKNAMSIWTGGSPKSNWEWKHMFYHCLVSAHCIKNQHRQTQTKKNKTWTLTPHDLYLPMPSQAWLPASLRPGRVCKEKIRKATNPNGRWWHRDSHTTCHSHWIVTKSWHLYPSSGSTTLAP